MSFLAGIIATLIERLLIFIFKIIAKDYQQWKEIKNARKVAQDGAKKIAESVTDEERRKNIEDALNNG